LGRKTALGCLSAILLSAGCSSSHRITIGSKNFTEQVILGEIIAQHLENRLHQTVERKLNLGGTLLAHQALLADGIDLYPEYTGTAFTNVLKRSGVNDPAVVLDQVRAAYATGFHLDWLDPLGFESSFAMTVRGEDARARHLQTLSDAAADSKGFTLGAGYEFLTRPDGYPALIKTYRLPMGASPKSMDLGLLYRALESNQVNMAAGSETDGMLAALDVTVLRDDRRAFPPYEAAFVVREASFEAHPGLREALAELSGKFNVKLMQNLNYQVDEKHTAVAEVARGFLKQAGLR